MNVQNSYLTRLQRSLAAMFTDLGRTDDRMNLEYPNPYTLVLRKTRTRALVNLMWILIGYGFFCFVFYQIYWFVGPDFWRGLEERELTLPKLILQFQQSLREQPVGLIFVFVFLLVFVSGFLSHIIKLVRICKVLLVGEAFHFDAATRKIVKNKKQVATFSDIARVEIRTIERDEGQSYYRTALILQSGAALFIAQSTEYATIANMVDSMARIINVPVTAA